MDKSIYYSRNLGYHAWMVKVDTPSHCVGPNVASQGPRSGLVEAFRTGKAERENVRNEKAVNALKTNRTAK